MKKIMSLLLVFTLLLALSLSFTSCFHECEFSTEWSKDGTAHWHACIGESCTEITDKADHVWNEGEITAKPTTEAEGVKTFTCTVCAATRTEPIAKCVLSAEWIIDETSHHRTCTNEGCPEIFEKGNHVWNEGEITTKPTQDADGVRTYTCTVCPATKTESVPFTGLSRSEWNTIFTDAVFENFAYSEIITVSASGISMDVETHYKFTESNAWVKVVAAGQSEELYAPDAASAIDLRRSLLDSIKSITPYACYDYDAETKTYKATENIYIESYEVYTSNISLTFENDRLVRITYVASVVEDGVTLQVSSVVTISDYGTIDLSSSDVSSSM